MMRFKFASIKKNNVASSSVSDTHHNVDAEALRHSDHVLHVAYALAQQLEILIRVLVAEGLAGRDGYR